MTAEDKALDRFGSCEGVLINANGDAVGRDRFTVRGRQRQAAATRGTEANFITGVGTKALNDPHLQHRIAIRVGEALGHRKRNDNTCCTQQSPLHSPNNSPLDKPTTAIPSLARVEMENFWPC